MDTATYLKHIISTQGPMTLAQYMGIVLSDPKHGYYMKKQPFGAEGDFITAPDISQMFGEMLGLWCADSWQKMGSPKRWHLVELGPGRGTLQLDLLRATSHIPGFLDGMQLHLVEMSPNLRQMQAAQLAAHKARISWHHTVDTLPDDAPLIVLANEFFDALPVHSFQRTAQGWREHMVGMDDKDALCITLSAQETLHTALMPETYRQHQKTDAVIEICPSGCVIMEQLAQRIAAQGGALLAIDYGYDTPPLVPTVQAVKRHAYDTLFSHPGEADVTVHVDFTQLAKAAQSKGLAVYPRIGQGQLLYDCGIETRKNMLLQRASKEQAMLLQTGYDRLISPEGMGTLFQCLIATEAGLEPPLGTG